MKLWPGIRLSKSMKACDSTMLIGSKLSTTESVKTKVTIKISYLVVVVKHQKYILQILSSWVTILTFLFCTNRRTFVYFALKQL